MPRNLWEEISIDKISTQISCEAINKEILMQWVTELDDLVFRDGAAS